MHELLIAGPFTPPTPGPSDYQQITWGDIAYRWGIPFWALRIYVGLFNAAVAAAIMFFLRYAGHEMRRDPFCSCGHRKARHLMTVGLGGSCRDCACQAFHER